MVEQAVRELEQLILSRCEDLMFEGWTYNLREGNYNSFQEMLDECKVTQHIQISTTGGSTAIYKGDFNELLRFWHDVIHIKLNLDFYLESEILVAAHQIAECLAYGLPDLSISILEADVIGQSLYYKNHGEFVKNQTVFIEDCLGLGIEETASNKQ